MRKNRNIAFFIISMIIIFFFIAYFSGVRGFFAHEILNEEGDRSISLEAEDSILETSSSTSSSTSSGYVIERRGNSIETRFLVPEGFERTKVEKKSFAEWLRKFPLKEVDAEVHYYNGQVKKYSVHEAVLELDVGKRDLQQCADSIIRLRAEYLLEMKEYEKIHYNFTNGFNASYKEWRSGKGIAVVGNSVKWVEKNYANHSYESFRRYLDMIFSYSGTLSLEKELKKRRLEDMEIGDVFIKGGSPGHCVIVVDTAINSTSGEKIFMVAQGFMPAQEMHVVKNLKMGNISPWYLADNREEFNFAGFSFSRNQLKCFE